MTGQNIANDLDYTVEYEYVSDMVETCKAAVACEGTELSHYVTSMCNAAEAMDGYFKQEDVRRIMDLAIDSTIHYLSGLHDAQWGWWEEYCETPAWIFENLNMRKLTKEEWHSHNNVEIKPDTTKINKFLKELSDSEVSILRERLNEDS